MYTFLYIDMPVHYKTKEKIQNLIKEFKQKNLTKPSAKELIETILKYKSPKDRNKAVKIAIEEIKASGFGARKRAKLNKLCKACELKGGEEKKEDDEKEEEKDEEGNPIKNPIPKKIPEDETFEKLWNRLFKLGEKVKKNVKKIKETKQQSNQEIRHQMIQPQRIVAQDRSGIIGIRQRVDQMDKKLSAINVNEFQKQLDDIKKKMSKYENKLKILKNKLIKEEEKEQKE